MRPHMVMFLGLIFVAGTLISLILQGAWFGSDDVDMVNSLSVIRPLDVGIWTLQVPNLEYFSTGLARLTMFDYGFFGGGYEVIQFLLITVIGSAVAWGIFTVVIVAASTLLGRR